MTLQLNLITTHHPNDDHTPITTLMMPTPLQPCMIDYIRVNRERVARWRRVTATLTSHPSPHPHQNPHATSIHNTTPPRSPHHHHNRHETQTTLSLTHSLACNTSQYNELHSTPLPLFSSLFSPPTPLTPSIKGPMRWSVSACG